eukprot:UN27207
MGMTDSQIQITTMTYIPTITHSFTFQKLHNASTNLIVNFESSRYMTSKFIVLGVQPLGYVVMPFI